MDLEAELEAAQAELNNLQDELDELDGNGMFGSNRYDAIQHEMADLEEEVNSLNEEISRG